MARPLKKGLDYYTMSTNWIKEESMLLLRYKWKSDGFLLFHILTADLYNSGYYLKISDSYLFSISGETRIREKKLVEMIDCMVCIHLFDEALWKTKRILTSEAIQTFYFMAKSKSIKCEDIINYKYILNSELMQKKQGVKSEKTQQRKGKESKVKESKENSKNKAAAAVAHALAVEAVVEPADKPVVVEMPVMKPKNQALSFQTCAESNQFKTKLQRETERHFRQQMRENPHKHSVSRVETAMRAASEAKELLRQQHYKLS